MATDISGFARLCQKFAEIDLEGKGPPIPPDIDLEQEIRRGAIALPQTFRRGYAEPLLENLLSVLLQTIGDLSVREALTGAVYDHIPESEVREPLHRFLAVISNLYRSFLSEAKRAAVNVPITSSIPPLAVFQSTGNLGPFTISSEQVDRLFGANIGVVSLPSTYRGHPVLWASLAHETGGHDVTHADEGLLPELAEGVRALFGVEPLESGREPTDRQLYGLLWSHWIDEAVADVYGILNMGPAFAFNLAALLAALKSKFTQEKFPSLRTQSGHPQGTFILDPHPTDILRLHLAIGVIENLNELSATTANAYTQLLEAVAHLCAQGADKIAIQGDIEINRDRWLRVDTTKPLEAMQRTARLVGAYIATAKVRNLNNHSIQDIETWSDTDEFITQQIVTAFQDTASVVDMGDDAQLLAGATLALLVETDRYDTVTKRLAEALDRSFERDPIWGTASPHPMFLRYDFYKPDAPDLRFERML